MLNDAGIEGESLGEVTKVLVRAGFAVFGRGAGFVLEDRVQFACAGGEGIVDRGVMIFQVETASFGVYGGWSSSGY